VVLNGELAVTSTTICFCLTFFSFTSSFFLTFFSGIQGTATVQITLVSEADLSRLDAYTSDE